MLLLLYLYLAAALLIVVLISAVAYHVATLALRRHEPTCGKCGYSARGLSIPECPECGADLREVGIDMYRQPRAPLVIATTVFVVLVGIIVVGAFFSLT